METKKAGANVGGKDGAPARPRIQTPWGGAALVERAVVRQQAGDRRFSSAVELLENERGERLVRFVYTTDGVVRRGPVTLRARDLERLRVELARTTELAGLLGLGGA